MRILAIPLAIIGLAIALAIAGPLNERWTDANEYHRQQEALQLAEQASKLADWQAQQQATAASRALASNAGYLGIVLLGALALYIGLDRYKRRAEPLVRFGGELVPRRLVESGRLIEILAHRLEMQDTALIEDKRRAIPPHVYSPHLTVRSTDLQLPEASPTQLAAPNVPSFAELLDQGKIGAVADGRAQPLILGYADTGAIEGSWGLIQRAPKDCSECVFDSHHWFVEREEFRKTLVFLVPCDFPEILTTLSSVGNRAVLQNPSPKSTYQENG